MINENYTYIVNNYLDFSMIAIPARVEKLIFNSNFTGDLPALYDFTNLKELVIEVPVNWEYVSQLELEGLESLVFTVDDSGPVCRIENNSIQNLEIYNISKKNLTPIEKIISSGILIGYDFSGLPVLKHLSLNYFLGFDFNKTKLPKSLESLNITNSDIKNVDWCLTVKNLKHINLDHNSVKDVNLLSYMPALESLSLQGNEIEYAKELSNIENLNYLNLLDNPLRDELSVRNDMKVETLILNQRDYELNMLKKLAKNLKSVTENLVSHYDRFITHRTPFVQMQNLKEKAAGEEKRLQQYYQLGFEHVLESISPFHYDYSYYSSEYKKSFMDFAKKYNPQLIIKDRFHAKLYKEIEFEKKGINRVYTSSIGSLFLVNEVGLYRLTVSKKNGDGKLNFDEKTVNERLKNVLIRSTILNLCKTDQKDIAISYDYDIKIERIYGSRADGAISLGIIVGIFSLLHNISISSDVAVYAQLNTRGSLKKTDINKNILMLLDKIGISHVILGKSTKKALALMSDTMRLKLKLHCCNKTDDILEYIDSLNQVKHI